MAADVWKKTQPNQNKKAFGQLLAATEKVRSLGEIQGTDLPTFGLPPSRRGTVHRRQKIDLQGTQRIATLNKRG